MKIIFAAMLLLSSVGFGAKTLDSVTVIVCQVNVGMTAVTNCGIHGKMGYGTDVGASTMDIRKLDHTPSAGEQTDLDAYLATLITALKSQEGI